MLGRGRHALPILGCNTGEARLPRTMRLRLKCGNPVESQTDSSVIEVVIEGKL